MVFVEICLEVINRATRLIGEGAEIAAECLLNVCPYGMVGSRSAGFLVSSSSTLVAVIRIVSKGQTPSPVKAGIACFALWKASIREILMSQRDRPDLQPPFSKA
jgi:hypothetical protein